ncbi:hypothetical protein AB0E59_45910 [Lentzea sp. NPDC034063]|uniref:hypothetical protein n=1 Tax=unclassified Lentzea TaxID=2643253 RepID=UPI0033CBF4DB
MRAEDVRTRVLEAQDSPAGVTIYRTWIDGLLDLDFLTMTGPLTLVGCHLPEEMTLRHAQIGTIDLSSTNVWGLRAKGLRTRELNLGGGRFSDILELEHAQIDGTFRLSAASIGSFTAYGLKVGGSLMARNLYNHPQYRGGVAFYLENAEIGGDVVLDGSTITGLDGPAIVANGAKVGGVFSLDGAILRGQGEGDAVSIIEAATGEVDLSGAVLRSEQGNALCIDGTQVRGEVRLDGINAVSNTRDNTIRMVSMDVSGAIVLSGLVRNRSGQAVSVHKATVNGGLNVRDVEIHASSFRGAALEISSCDVGGALICVPNEIVNSGSDPELDLTATKVGRAFAIKTEGLARVTLHDLTYQVTRGSVDAWLTMLRDHTIRYEAQPYQQLAAVHRSAGHEHTARRVLIAQQQDLRRRGDPGNKLWHWFLGVTLGYGYRPSRAVIGLLVTFLLALCLVWTTNAYNGLTPAKDRPADSCSPVNRISLAADLAIPLVKLGGTPRCELANGPAGQWATGAGWVVQILGWSFATLSVAGFTGLVRKS